MTSLWAALLTWLKGLKPELVQLCKLLMAGKIGADVQRGRDAQYDLAKLEESAKAAARVDLLPTDDVVRQLKERGLYRLSPESPNRE